MIDLGLTGKRALVAGAGHRPPRPGFGRVSSLLLADAGARVACLDFDEDRAKATAAEVTAAGGEAIAVVADLTKREQVGDAIAEVVGAVGGLDVCVDIVGGARWGTVLDFTDEDWHWTMETNLRQNFLLLQAAGRQMVAQGSGGAIVSVASVDGLASSKHHVAYGAAKAGVISLAKTFAQELGPYGVRVNAVAPGNVGPGNEGPGESEFGADPFAPLASPRTRDIGNAILFFASDLSARVSGHTMPVDGGATTRALFGYDQIDDLRRFSPR
jgi:3-oxoacyl-[acyl-carrier protein] reductase